LIVGILIGYGLRDVVLLQRTQTLSRVVVLEKYDDYNYRLMTENGQAFNARFCLESKVNFVPGEILSTLSYEQQRGCKNIVGKNLGFIR
jgi:hypothetical protein